MKKQDLSSQMQCIIACCQSKPTQKDIDLICSYLSQITNYESLITAASQHGVLPLVYKTLKKLSESNSSLLTPTSSLAAPAALDPSDVNRNTNNEPSQSDNIHSSLLTPHSSLENILTELKAHYMSISRRNMLMSAELLRIMKLLEANNIEALAFKGPALAQMAYGNITMRQFGDLDVL
ncbi:MAG: nucleotidyltransferase family protein, partial [Campylobacterales bacterium]|nr:nucleotidyltransferase family protein [Campylobacterales bacterium]